MTNLLPMIVILGSLLPAAQQADIVWVANGEFCEPETVLPLPDNTLLVSNVCGFAEMGNGFLSLLDGNGQALDWRFIQGLDSPLGMAQAGERVYVVDSNRLKVFAWPEFDLLNTVDLDTKVANDVAVKSDGTIFVTDTAGHQVIVVSANGDQSVLMGKPMFQGANGVHVDGDVLYVGGARLWRVDLLENSVEDIGPKWLVDVDGIELEPDGVLQITPVAGPLIRYCNQKVFEVLDGPGVSSANHGFASRLGLALIPTGFDNSVIAIRVPDDGLAGGVVRLQDPCVTSIEAN